MRTGAIFARGSCRALKWLALFGVVFALGAGSAAAQITVTVPDEVNEDADVDLRVGGTLSIPVDTPAGILTIAASAAPTAGTATATATAGEAEDFGSIASVQIATPANPSTATAARSFSIPAGHALVWSVGRDPNNAEDEVVNVGAFTATHTVTTGTAISGITGPTGKDGVVIKDTDPQGYELSGATSITEGNATATTLTLTAVPPLTVRLGGDSGEASFGLEPNDPSKFTLTPGDVTFGGTEGTADATIQALADGDRDDGTVTVTAYGGSPLAALDALDLSVTDVNALPETADITAVAYSEMTGGDMVTSVEEGDTVYLEVMADRGSDGYPSGEAIEVALSTDSSLATLGAEMAVVPDGTGEQKAPRVALTATEVDTFPQAGMLDVSLTASGATATNGSGSVTGTPLSLTITDATVKQTSVKDGAMAALYGARDAAMGSDGMLNPGDDFSVDNDMLFDSADGFTFQVDARSSMPAVVSVDDSSGDSISIMPESAGGPAKITLTATAIPETSSFIPTQVSESVATIEFEVTVAAAAVAAPSMPQNLMADAGDGQVMLSWEAPATGDDPTGYQFRYGDGTLWSAWAATLSMTGHTVTGLTNGTAYTFEVTAMNAGGNGPAASVMATPVAPTVDPVAPSAPQNLMADADDGQVMLSWEAPATGDDPTGYQFRSSVDNRWSDWAATSSMTAHTVMGLTNGKEYTFEVRAMNAAGNGPAASATATPMAAPTRAKRGQITEFELIGAVEEKTIAGVKRLFVDEGEQNVELSVTV